MRWRCPICGRPTESSTDADFPFCRPRCRLLDLGQWAGEEYHLSEPPPQGSESQQPTSSHDHSSTDA